MSSDTGAIKALIKARCGLSIEDNGEGVLLQALTERAKALAIQTASYYARLVSDEAEFQELVNRLTVNETYFFREPEQIRLLVDRLAPRFLAAREGQAPLRILSAGCSSGEEPYSLVMALMDRYGQSVSRLFDFVGGDIDSTVLAKARHARYTEFSFRGVPASVRSHYFDKDCQTYVLKPEVKKLVHFHELNLLADNQPIFFKLSQTLGQHHIGDAAHAALKLVVAHCFLISQMPQYGQLPLAPNAPENMQDGAFIFIVVQAAASG